MRSIFGPHICGDSLDIVGKEVLTGSWRPDKQLELWDFESGNKVTSLQLDKYILVTTCRSYFYQKRIRIKENYNLLTKILFSWKITDIPWSASVTSGQPSCMLYAAQFSKEGYFPFH